MRPPAEDEVHRGTDPPAGFDRDLLDDVGFVRPARELVAEEVRPARLGLARREEDPADPERGPVGIDHRDRGWHALDPKVWPDESLTGLRISGYRAST
jgi:hypothetical protein